MTIFESERVVRSVIQDALRHGRPIVGALAEAVRDACAETRRDCARTARDHGADPELVAAIAPRHRRNG